jgi:hypothetical protein
MAQPAVFTERVAVVLMVRILDLIRESGANGPEAISALSAATAMLPELKLPTETIHMR